MPKITWLILVSILSGCASTDSSPKVSAAITAGRCEEAWALASADPDRGRSNNNLGMVALQCEKDIVRARTYFVLGAGNGNKSAIQNLENQGWELPKPIALPTKTEPAVQEISGSNSWASAAELALILLGAVADAKKSQPPAVQPSQQPQNQGKA